MGPNAYGSAAGSRRRPPAALRKELSRRGRIRRWIDNTVDLDEGKFVRLYRGKVYVFGERNVLITILNVPGNLQKQLNIQTKATN